MAGRKRVPRATAAGGGRADVGLLRVIAGIDIR